MKVIIKDGVVYRLVEAPAKQLEIIKELVRKEQVRIYVEKCKEPSTEIVEGRIYEI